MNKWKCLDRNLGGHPPRILQKIFGCQEYSEQKVYLFLDYQKSNEENIIERRISGKTFKRKISTECFIVEAHSFVENDLVIFNICIHCPHLITRRPIQNNKGILSNKKIQSKSSPRTLTFFIARNFPTIAFLSQSNNLESNVGNKNKTYYPYTNQKLSI